MTDLPASLEVGRALGRLMAWADGNHGYAADDLRTLVSEVERLQKVIAVWGADWSDIETALKLLARADKAEAELAATQERLRKAESDELRVMTDYRLALNRLARAEELLRTWFAMRPIDSVGDFLNAPPIKPEA